MQTIESSENPWSCLSECDAFVMFEHLINQKILFRNLSESSFCYLSESIAVGEEVGFRLKHGHCCCQEHRLSSGQVRYKYSSNHMIIVRALPCMFKSHGMHVYCVQYYNHTATLITRPHFPPDYDPTFLQPLRVLPIFSLCQRHPTLQMVIKFIVLVL